MKSTVKLTFQLLLTLLVLGATSWLASSDRLRHYPNNRILNQSAISAIKTVGPVSAGFELNQPVDTTQINDSNPDLYDLPLCVHVFLDATDGTYFPGTLSFELSAAGRTSKAALHSSEIPNTFQRICFPQSSMRMLLGARDANLRISVLEPGAKNVARIVLAPPPAGASAATINGVTSAYYLPYMIEVQKPAGTTSWVRTLGMLAFASVALLIIFAGSASVRRPTSVS